MDWKLCSNEFPKKEGQYLCVNKYTNGYVYRVNGFALRLSKIDKYDFEDCNYSGFYDYNGEWGYYETKPYAWCEINEFKEDKV